MKIICETNIKKHPKGCEVKGCYQKSTLAIGKKGVKAYIGKSKALCYFNQRKQQVSNKIW